MPSREATLKLALPQILSQVDRLFMYLDGHVEVPSFVRGDERIVTTLARKKPGLHASGKFLPLWQIKRDFLFVGFDDDILYPPFYTATLAAELDKHAGRVVAGYHGAVLAEPILSYRRDRKVLHFQSALSESRPVDVLGTGTLMLDTKVLRFDARAWGRPNSLDVPLARVAADKGLPMICVARGASDLQALEHNQPDSCFAALVRDDSYETALARQLKESLKARGINNRA